MPGVSRFVSKLFYYLKRAICRKTVLRFVSNTFLIFGRGNKERNCVRYFEMRKYAFLIFENENK